MWDSSPRAAPGARFQSNVLTTRLRVGILIGNQNWSKLSRSGDVQPEIKLPWPHCDRAPPDIFETGGDYTGVGGVRNGPGNCLSAAQVRAQYGYDSSRLPRSGPWYSGGWESDTQSRHRAARVASWPQSEGFAAEVDGALVVLVIHGLFINHLAKALLRIRDGPPLDSATTNDHLLQPVVIATPNTATTLLEVSASRRKVVVRWVNRTDPSLALYGGQTLKRIVLSHCYQSTITHRGLDTTTHSKSTSSDIIPKWRHTAACTGKHGVGASPIIPRHH